MTSQTITKDMVKSIWSMSAAHPQYVELLQAWKDNMSTQGSKIITSRIQWTEQVGKLPLIILGVKGDRIRYAAFGGSDSIHYCSTSEWNAHPQHLVMLDAKTNDEVSAWRDAQLKVEPAKVEKAAAGKPKAQKEAAPKGNIIQGRSNPMMISKHIDDLKVVDHSNVVDEDCFTSGVFINDEDQFIG
jgi:hypothetical protein